MNNSLFIVTILFITGASFAQNLPADSITGIWISNGSDVGLRFEIFKSENKCFGKLVWASTMFVTDGKTPKKDIKNSDRNLRNRSRQNIINVTNLTFDDDEYTGEKLYNPDDESIYSLNVH